MKKILIANRGEIARRVIRTAHAMGIETVAVYSEPDAGALHVREATCAYALGGVTSADSYLRIDRLLQAARASGADAVHPGYGFLSEDAGFAQAVLDAGLVWIGPPPAAIRALGSKSAAKALVTAQGVPCLPGYAGQDQSDERFAAEAGRVGYPLMVKAAAGGGGRGMRLVHEPGQLPAALAGARSEALASFGNAELLIEQALLHPRHVEIQVFADAHGHCIHLGERDCSVQRRHQKIIEEAPSPAVDEALRERMGACAIALARAAGYVGAGTVEYLLDNAGGSAVNELTSVEVVLPRQQGPRNRLCRAAGAAAPSGGSAVREATSVGAFFFMEMNTRLQVEHPVTEALTGLDLVEWQIRVARGETLPLAQNEVRFQGHAIEVRLCAEDENFIPHTGRVLHFSGPAATPFGSMPTGLRFDHAIEPGLEVTPHYDAMLGKLIAHADTREAAIDRLVQALGQTELLGLPTNRGFLAACLDHPQFRAGQALVAWLSSEAHAVRRMLLKKEQEMAVRYGLAAIFVKKMVFHSLPCPFPRPLRLRHRDTVNAMQGIDLGAGRWLLEGGGEGALPREEIHLLRLADGTVQCTRGGMTQRVRVVQVGEQRWHLQAGAVDWWLEDMSLESTAGTGSGIKARELRAPFNGCVVSVAAVAGEDLAAGDTAVVIESMKLEHSLAASSLATVAEVLVSPGQQVAPGQLLVRFATEGTAA